MKINIISVGNIKEKYLKDAILEYSKRLSKYTKVEFLSTNDEPICDNPSKKDEEIVKNKEGERLLKLIPESSYKIVLDLKGTMLSSPELAEKISSIFTYQKSSISFIIAAL